MEENVQVVAMLQLLVVVVVVIEQLNSIDTLTFVDEMLRYHVVMRENLDFLDRELSRVYAIWHDDFET